MSCDIHQLNRYSHRGNSNKSRVNKTVKLGDSGEIAIVRAELVSLLIKNKPSLGKVKGSW